MKAIILAAGRGSRLGALTESKPKCLTEIGGKALLQWQLEALRRAGFKEIGVVRGYRAECIAIPEVTYFENSRWAETNMVRSLLCASEWLSQNECLISYSDILYTSETIKKLSATDDDIAICHNTKWLEVWQARFDDPLVDAETFQIDAKAFLTEIGKRAERLEEIQGQYMGLLKFKKEGWEKIASILNAESGSTLDRMDMTSMLNRLITAGVKIKTVPIEGNWFEIDSEDDIKSYLKWKKQYMNDKNISCGGN